MKPNRPVTFREKWQMRENRALKAENVQRFRHETVLHAHHRLFFDFLEEIASSPA